MPQRRHHGFTLVEIMMSVFILAIGIIGVAGLQLSAYRVNQQALLAVSATDMARDIAERIRANDGVANVPSAANPYFFDTQNQPTVPTKKCFGKTECSPLEIAVSDVYEWHKKLNPSVDEPSAGGLPGGRGVVCRDENPWEENKGYRWSCGDSGINPNAPVVVKIGWLEKNVDGSYAKTDKQEYDDRPAIVVVIKP